MNSYPAVSADDGLEINLAPILDGQRCYDLKAEREGVILVMDVGYGCTGQSRLILVDGGPDAGFYLADRVRVALQEIEEVGHAVISGQWDVALAGVENALQVGQHRFDTMPLVLAAAPQGITLE